MAFFWYYLELIFCIYDLNICLCSLNIWSPRIIWCTKIRFRNWQLVKMFFWFTAVTFRSIRSWLCRVYVNLSDRYFLFLSFSKHWHCRRCTILSFAIDNKNQWIILTILMGLNQFVVPNNKNNSINKQKIDKLRNKKNERKEYK